MIRPLLVIGVVAGVFAGALAYLISLDEAKHHFTNRAARREALHSAVAAAVFFLVLGALIAVSVSATIH